MNEWEQDQKQKAAAFNQALALQDGAMGGLSGILGNLGLGTGLQNAPRDFYQYVVHTSANNNIVWDDTQPTLVRHTQEAAKNPEVAWLTRRVKEVSWYGDTE